MGIFDNIGLTNRGRTRSARKTIAQFMTTLSGTDCYGIPPISVYQRFNSAGSNFHGQCAVAQGACGFRFGGKLKIDVAKLIPMPTPLTASGQLDLSAARLPTSAVMMFRLPAELTAVDNAPTPLSVAQLDGINWTFTSKMTVTVGAKTQAFDKLADLDLTVAANARYTYLFTNLVAFETTHYAGDNWAGAARKVDGFLAVDIKKTLVNVLANFEAEFRKSANAPGLAVGKSRLMAIALKRREQMISIGQRAAVKIVRNGGFDFLPASMLRKDVRAAGEVVYQAFLDEKNSRLDAQTLKLQKTLEGAHAKAKAALPSKPTPAQILEVSTLDEAVTRLKDLRRALTEETVFAGTAPVKVGAVPKVTSKHLERTDETALSLSSHEYGGQLSATGKLKVDKIAASAKASADLMGQKLDFRFQVRAANGMMLVQDTHADFMQMTRKVALDAGLSLTGVKAVDSKLKSSATKTITTPGGSKKLGQRHFGALRYRAATAYVEKAGPSSLRIAPRVSGLSLGVSLRAARLISYAHETAHLSGRTPAIDPELRAFEEWVTLHLGCGLVDLRGFIGSSLLADCEIGENGETVFPTDALLVEANYGLGAGAKLTITPKGNGAPPDLFEHMGFTTASAFQADVARGTFDLSSMRLRYRVQTPLKTTAKTFFTLGLPLDEHLPVTANIEFGSNKEVGQESIVDLTTWFSPETCAMAETDFDKNEISVPPVVLFNRC